MAWIPVVLAALGTAASVNNSIQASQPKKAQTPAATPGGGGQMNPVGDLLMQLGGQDPNGASAPPPAPIQTPPMTQTPVENPPTTQLPDGNTNPLAQAGGDPAVEMAAQDSAAKKKQEIGDMLSSIPEALAAASDLLGFNQDKRKTPVPGSGFTQQNNYAQAFGGLPRPPTLGEILAALPRPGGR